MSRIVTVMLMLIAAVAAAQAPTSLAIAHVTVIDVANGTLLSDRTVMMAGDRIQSVVAGTTAIPNGARVIDGRGKYLIPGLWDMHVHLSYARSSAFPALIANGVTFDTLLAEAAARAAVE